MQLQSVITGLVILLLGPILTRELDHEFLCTSDIFNKLKLPNILLVTFLVKKVWLCGVQFILSKLNILFR